LAGRLENIVLHGLLGQEHLRGDFDAY